ncbi:MAG: S1/P1 nuclease, partial [Gammaproteobacteria bacterium]
VEYPKPFSKNLIQEDNPAQWFAECQALAKNVAYTMQKGESPSAKYIHESQAVVKSQLALAGYRLGHQLNQILK